MGAWWSCIAASYLWQPAGRPPFPASALQPYSRHTHTLRCRPASLPPQVRDFYNTYFAPGSPSRRKLSVHIVGRAHTAELAAEAPEGVQLVPEMQALPRELPLWPAMLGDTPSCS